MRGVCSIYVQDNGVKMMLNKSIQRVQTSLAKGSSLIILIMSVFSIWKVNQIYSSVRTILKIASKSAHNLLSNDQIFD